MTSIPLKLRAGSGVSMAGISESGKLIIMSSQRRISAAEINWHGRDSVIIHGKLSRTYYSSRRTSSSMADSGSSDGGGGSIVVACCYQ